LIDLTKFFCIQLVLMLCVCVFEKPYYCYYSCICFLSNMSVLWMTATSNGISGSSSDLASLFECPVCFDYALPPIMQCQSGHIVCSHCRPKLQFCPTCRGTLGKQFWSLFYILLLCCSIGTLGTLS